MYFRSSLLHFYKPLLFKRFNFLRAENLAPSRCSVWDSGNHYLNHRTTGFMVVLDSSENLVDGFPEKYWVFQLLGRLTY